MKIEVKRIALKDKYTIGHMYIDGKFDATHWKIKCET